LSKQLPGLSPDTSDWALVQRSLARDHAAFTFLVQRYHASLVGYISRWYSDHALVQDIVQHVLLQLYVSLPVLRAAPTIWPWLMRVAHNRCVDELRRTRPVLFSRLAEVWEDEDVPLLETLPDPAPQPEEVVERREVQQRIRQAIGTLPLKQRRIVWMRYAEQLTFAEIGQRLHLPLSTVKTSFWRARLALRQELREEIH
jgi:RNA polymerase sigma-70 factor, ECF subfamily